jgi:oligoendopeptidase F
MGSGIVASTDLEQFEAGWDLEPLLGDVVGANGPERVTNLLADAVARADAFAESYRGHVARLDVRGLRTALAELAAIKDLVTRADCYAALWWSVDTGDQARGALVQSVQERVTEVHAQLLVFDVEWVALPDERADALIDAVRGDSGVPSHYLRRLRARLPHMLSEPEERILAEVSVTTRDAWKRQYSEHHGAIRVKLDGESVSIDAAVARFQEPDRECRRLTGEALKTALTDSLSDKAFIYNTLLYEKSVHDRLRSYPHWLANRNLENETSDESVEALTEAVLNAADTARRWYRLKARLLGIDQIADYDRFAPLGAEDTRVSYGEARDLVIGTYAQFDPEAGDLVRQFFDDRWIDAPPRPGKTGGAFCHDGAASVHPYVLLNFEGTPADVLYMAHELGHGLHAALARRCGPFALEPTLTIAETASVFGETLMFERMLGEADDRGRLSLLAQRLDATIQTLFEPISIHLFEQRVHAHRRAAGELSVELMTEAWTDSQARVYGDSFATTFNHVMWAYYPHFVLYPGYVYAYAYGQLLSLSAFARYRQAGPPFASDFLTMLAAGSSKPPLELASIIGCDLTDPEFWNSGLALVRKQVEAAEKLGAAFLPE